jgi:chromosomal replication initiator protein
MSTMREIAAEVAHRYGLEPDELKTQSRRRYIARPRQEAMWLMRQVKREDGTNRYSMPQIAGFFGMKDHTTVWHAERAVEARMVPEAPE